MLIGVRATLPFSAAAEEKRFAVVSLYNQTGDVTIHLSYRWGNENWAQFTNSGRDNLIGLQRRWTRAVARQSSRSKSMKRFALRGK
jgi:hypothetical protein